ncbi:hypothetical protein GCM10010965_25470 [Caldalkalibacillus thermarum]|nr:hypothetical protein GCM10010965_25470 [Caldalkalibacillus thermarum]
MTMNLDYKNGLLYTSITLTYQGKSAVIEQVIVDTGAAQTLISADAVFDLGIYATPHDELTIMSGIGGVDYAFRKRIDRVTFGSFEVHSLPLDFGNLDEGFGINGIIGLDILVKGKFIIDLADMIILQK